MHGVRGVYNLIFILLVASGIIFSGVYADQTPNITYTAATAMPTEVPTTAPAEVLTEVPTTVPTEISATIQSYVPTTVATELPTTLLTGIPTTLPTLAETTQIMDNPLVATKETTTPEVTDGSCSGVSSVSEATCGSTPKMHPLMHLSKAQLDEEEVEFQTIEKYSAPVKRMSLMADSGPVVTSKSLLPYISYVPSERDQGYCGNCWVWASTGALEVDHTVKTGVNERLSIQYFNSKYNNGQSGDWACCGGNIQTFTSWYGSDRSPIPWSNANAGYGDYFSQCSDTTAIPIGAISTDPHFGLNSISYSPVATNGSGITQSAAIANIKAAIDNNQAVYYSFNYGTAGWTAFNNYWSFQAESVTWDPDSYGGVETAGGHGVLVVGYDTSDPSNPYWIVLNSWGTRSGRPNGLFRLKMDMNYDNTFTNTYLGTPYTYIQHKFYVMDAEFDPGEKIGVFRNPRNWYLDSTGNGTWGAGDTTYGFGLSGDIPVTGDWNGDGKTEIGVFRNGRNWYLDTNGNGVWGAGDTTYGFGLSGDIPVTGDWNGDGKTEIGVFRNGRNWYLDMNGNGVWGAGDTTYGFGITDDTPVVGKW